MKLFTQLVLFLLASLNTIAQTFGPDITVFDDPNITANQNFIEVGCYNRIYVGFNYHEISATGYRVLVSVDNGLSWQMLIDYYASTGAGWYPQLTDMLVAGTDSTNLRVFLTLCGPGNGGPGMIGGIFGFSGITGNSIGNTIYLGDFFTYRINDVAVCSDFTHPLGTSNPYSVAVVYSVDGNRDSLNYLFSDDGGLNFSGPYEIANDSAGDYGNVDIAYGSYQSQAVGKFGITFTKGNNICTSFTDVGSPTSFNGYTILDTLSAYTSGKCLDPKICMQNDTIYNSSADYTTVILSEVENTANASRDLVTFYLDDTQNGGNWNFEIIDSSSNETSSSSIIFNPANSNFIATYFDTTSKQLPLIYHDMNFPGNWTRTLSDYPDTMKFLNPTPCLGIINSINSIVCSWKQLSDDSLMSTPIQTVKFDFMSLPLSISGNKDQPINFLVSPNPTTNGFSVHTSQQIENLDITITNSLGQSVYFLKQYFNSSNDIYISALPKGIYTIHLNNGSAFGTRKLIVQ